MSSCAIAPSAPITIVARAATMRTSSATDEPGNSRVWVRMIE